MIGYNYFSILVTKTFKNQEVIISVVPVVRLKNIVEVSNDD